MIPKPSAINRVGIVQFFLAAAFVIWLLFFPDTGDRFAWPVVPRLTAMFLGTSFILRTFLGYHLWRETEWYRLRWIVWGNFTFLGVIFVATFWHVDEMNWERNIVVAHIWVLAYIVEPLILVLIEPHEAAARAPVPENLRGGEVGEGLRRTLGALFIFGVALGGLLFIHPTFMDTRWPWPLDPFDARIMAAFPAACGVWAATMYFKRSWAEIRMGVQSLIVYGSALFVVWLVTYSSYEAGRKNGLTYGVVTGAFAALLIYFYWRQERARMG